MLSKTHEFIILNTNQKKLKKMSTVGDSGNYRAIARGIINGKIFDNVIMFKTSKCFVSINMVK